MIGAVAPAPAENPSFSVCLRGACGGFGIALATSRSNGGSLVPFASRTGAIAALGFAASKLGSDALGLLEWGLPVERAIASVLGRDPDAQRRQLHGVDATGMHAFTGAETLPLAGHLTGDGISIAGNKLPDLARLEAMLRVAEATREMELGERLLLVLEAGRNRDAGPEGQQSAALLAASPQPRLHHNLRVDDHADPIRELRRLYEVMRVQADEIRTMHGERAFRAISRVRT